LPLLDYLKKLARFDVATNNTPRVGLFFDDTKARQSFSNSLSQGGKIALINHFRSNNTPRVRLLFDDTKARQSFSNSLSKGGD
jgi:hypothetical protein